MTARETRRERSEKLRQTKRKSRTLRKERENADVPSRLDAVLIDRSFMKEG